MHRPLKTFCPAAAGWHQSTSKKIFRLAPNVINRFVPVHATPQPVPFNCAADLSVVFVAGCALAGQLFMQDFLRRQIPPRVATHDDDAFARGH